MTRFPPVGPLAGPILSNVAIVTDWVDLPGRLDRGLRTLGERQDDDRAFPGRRVRRLDRRGSRSRSRRRPGLPAPGGYTAVDYHLRDRGPSSRRRGIAASSSNAPRYNGNLYGTPRRARSTRRSKRVTSVILEIEVQGGEGRPRDFPATALRLHRTRPTFRGARGDGSGAGGRRTSRPSSGGSRPTPAASWPRWPTGTTTGSSTTTSTGAVAALDHGSCQANGCGG